MKNYLLILLPLALMTSCVNAPVTSTPSGKHIPCSDLKPIINYDMVTSEATQKQIDDYNIAYDTACL